MGEGNVSVSLASNAKRLTPTRFSNYGRKGDAFDCLSKMQSSVPLTNTSCLLPPPLWARGAPTTFQLSLSMSTIQRRFASAVRVSVPQRRIYRRGQRTAMVLFHQMSLFPEQRQERSLQHSSMLQGGMPNPKFDSLFSFSPQACQYLETVRTRRAEGGGLGCGFVITAWIAQWYLCR